MLEFVLHLIVIDLPPKLGFCSSSNTPCISTIAEDIEDTLFNKIIH